MNDLYYSREIRVLIKFYHYDGMIHEWEVFLILENLLIVVDEEMNG
jgi:hypothetical protein